MSIGLSLGGSPSVCFRFNLPRHSEYDIPFHDRSPGTADRAAAASLLRAAKMYPPSCVSREQKKSPLQHCRFRTHTPKRMPDLPRQGQRRFSRGAFRHLCHFALARPRTVRRAWAAHCQAHRRAELGYWLGVPFWGKDYVTEAARAAVAFGFETLGLNRIYAHHFAGNTASGRVLEKIGMRHEGRSRQHIQKWDQFVDIENYGVLAEEFRRSEPARRSDDFAEARKT